MLKSKKSFLVLLMSLIFVVSMVFVFSTIKTQKANADTISKIYSLDFSNSSNRGQNGAGTSYADATIVNGGNVTYTANAKKGYTSFNIVSSGCRTNYLSIPASVLQDKSSLTFAGWFKVSSSIPVFSRIFEINSGEGDCVMVMPYHTSNYNGLAVDVKVNNVWANQAQVDAHDGDVAYHSIFHKGADTSSAYNMPLQKNGSPLLDTWVHYAYEITPTGIYYYINGELADSFSGDFTASTFYAENGIIYLGATNFDSTVDATCSYADFRIYNGALTSSQIKEEFNLLYSDFLTLNYSLDNTTESVRGYNGTLEGNATIGTAYGRSGVLITTGQTNSGLSIPSSSLKGHNKLTISMDVYTESTTPAYSRIFDFSPYQSAFLSLSANFNGNNKQVLKFTKNNNVTDYTIEKDDIYGSWDNIIVTLDGTTAKIYVNGVLTNTNSSFQYTDAIFWEGNGNMMFGGEKFWNDGSLQGAIDNIKIWSVALTASEIYTERETYTITYHLDGGTNGDNPSTYTTSGSTITLKNATKTGYFFRGWYLESTFDTKVTEITTGSTGNKTFYARFIKENNTASISPTGAITVNFYLDVNVYTDDTESFVTITHLADMLSYDKEYITDTIYIKDLEPELDGTYKFEVVCASGQMTDGIWVALFDSQNTPLWSKASYTIREYCETVIVNKDADADLVNLCKAMLNFGAKAQAQFKYNTDDLANRSCDWSDKIESVDVSGITEVDSVVNTTEDITLIKKSFVFLDNTCVRYYFSVADAIKIKNNYNVSVTNGLEIKYGLSPLGRYVEVNGIASCSLQETFVLSIVSKTDETKKLEITYSPIGFIKAKVNDDATASTVKTLLKALYVYNVYSRIYFGIDVPASEIGVELNW